MQTPRGVTDYITEDGICVVKIHYTADPGKDPETPEGADWLENQLIGYPGGMKGINWRKEMEIDFSVFEGKAVYSANEWQEERHVAPVPLLPLVCNGIKAGRTTVIRGWDNTGLSPACIVTYINSIGQWFWVKEFTSEDTGIVEFGNAVKMWCATELPAETKYRDIGDPAGATRDTTKKSPVIYLAEECGIMVEPGIQTFKVRRDAVAGRLQKTINGQPALMVDRSCTMVIMGFNGGYCYPEIGSSGYYGTEPDKLKNPYTHIHDAGQYPATRLFGNVNEAKPKKGPGVMDKKPRR